MDFVTKLTRPASASSLCALPSQRLVQFFT